MAVTNQWPAGPSSGWVSVGVFAPLVGRASRRGPQVIGAVRLRREGYAPRQFWTAP